MSVTGRINLWGDIDPDPLEDEPLVPDSDLIGACLSATGVLASVPGSVNNTDAMRQFE